MLFSFMILLVFLAPIQGLVGPSGPQALQPHSPNLTHPQPQTFFGGLCPPHIFLAPQGGPFSMIFYISYPPLHQPPVWSNTIFDDV